MNPAAAWRRVGRAMRVDRLPISLLAVVLTCVLAASGYAANGRPAPNGGPKTPPATCTASQFKATYFSNTSLSGTPVLTRCETTIDNTWNGGSPDPSVPTDNFSARWVGDFSFAAGTFAFTVTADDGVRLYVDGALLIDKWFDQSFTTYKAMKTLAAGSHQVKVEYYEHLYGAVAKADWTSTSSDLVAPTPPASLHATTVSATSAELAWDPATDNVAVVGYEVLQGASAVSTTASLTSTVAGLACGTTYPLGVRAYDAAGNRSAAASVSVTTTACPKPPVTCSAGTFQADYFTSTSPTGTPLVSRCENAIDNTWNGGSPDPSVPSDNFSARWVGDFGFAAGDTVFSVIADDGVRLWVDGALLIDKWIDQPATTYKATKTLSAGSHQVKVEYYEHQYGAVAKASWTTGSTPPPPEPPVSGTGRIGTSSHTRNESDLRDAAAERRHHLAPRRRSLGERRVDEGRVQLGSPRLGVHERVPRGHQRLPRDRRLCARLVRRAARERRRLRELLRQARQSGTGRAGRSGRATPRSDRWSSPSSSGTRTT